MKIWREIVTVNDQSNLQQDIDALHQWSVNNKINFHAKKCKVLRATVKRSPLEFSYSMAGTVLEISDEERDLGVIVSSNFKWIKQHRVLLGKCNQKLGLLKRSCSFSKSIESRKILYLSIIRSQFEHCSPIWRPITNAQISKFEALQKRSVKWIFNENYCSYSAKNYFHKPKRLDILPLRLKFDYNGLVMFYKIVNNISCIKMPTYLISSDSINNNNTNMYFQRNTRQFRENDNLKFKSTINPKVDAFSNSFFPRTHLKWNTLPYTLRSSVSTVIFQKRLKEYLWLTAEDALSSM